MKILKNFIFFIIFILFVMLQSCDDFLLKKTVSVQYLKGDISFDNNSASLSGNLDYEIKNKQQDSMTEIYLISHSMVSIDLIRYNGETMRFEQGLDYGSGIYKISIPPLRSEETANIELHFNLPGPIQDERFLLTKDNVFIDAQKIWIPVPFAQTPRFNYTLKIRTHDDYYSIMGGALKEETVKNNKRTETWVSETDDAILTGNIFISKFNRIKEDNIFLYTINTNNSDVVFRYASQILETLSNNLGLYPFSQVHIINELFQYMDMEEFIDGKASANIIEISPDITSQVLTGEDDVIASLNPDIPRNSVFKVYETLAHEMSHAYVRGILKFEDDNYLQSESLTEYMGLLLISMQNQSVFKKFMKRNRIELINLFLAKGANSDLLKYLYGINCLYSAFYNNEKLFFNYLQILIEKYRYTDIRVSELQKTALEMNPDNSETNEEQFQDFKMDGNALRLWNNYKLYNIRLSYSNIQTTNFQHRRPEPEERKLIILNHDFPIDIDLVLYENFKNYSRTNFIKLVSNSETNFIAEKDIQSVEVKSRYESLERYVFNNRLVFTNSSWNELFDGINNFYNGQRLTKNVTFDKSEVKQEGWHNLFEDREKSLLINTNIQFVFDDFDENEEEFYIQAYKLIDNKPFSYVIFKGKKLREKYEVTAVIDPII